MKIRKKGKNTKEITQGNIQKKLRKEISYLNSLLMDVQEESWDVKGIYRDIRDGTDNGNEIGGVPNKKMASWFAKRWNLNEEDCD